MWKDINTTKIYTHISQKRLDKIESPLNRIGKSMFKGKKN
jgi:hypothetical protein